jgi:transcriptional regulator with XRE-family HTH domain
MYGERIRGLRKQRGMTLRDLSRELGIPFTTLGNYEREDREPNFETFKSIADYFQVSIDYLTGRRNNEKIFSNRTNINFLTHLEGELLNAPPEICNTTINIFEQLYSVMDGEIESNNLREIELLAEIINFISRMKNGFNYNVKTEDNFLQPINHYDYAIIYRNEKLELDKRFNELFDLYVKNIRYLK